MTATPLHHPAREELVAFGLGRLQPDQAAKIETHLSDCQTCCETLLDLKDDTFVSLVRKSPQPRNDDDIQATIDSKSGVTGEAAAPAELPAELLQHSRCDILELIGRGGMGDVYKAQHQVMNRTVALKVIKPELVRNATAVDRFQREVQAAARLDHGNIVTAHDAGQAGNLHFLVMEYVNGIDLSQIAGERGALAVSEACDYIRQAAAGLQHAHQFGMVHRDIKPHNLMLTRSGEVKILDFGLANFASEVVAEDVGNETSGAAGEALHPLQQLTQLGAMMGTPDYIAPEQAEDASTADIRSDIYSLGCTLYFLLTGKPLFEFGSVADKLKAHAESEPPILADSRDDIPPQLQEVVDRMLAKDPAERFQTPAEVADALADFVDRHRTDGGAPQGPLTGISIPQNPLPFTFALCFAGTLSTLAFVMGVMLFMSAGWLAGLPNWIRLWLQFGGMMSLPVGALVLYLADRSERRNSHASAVKAGLLNLLPLNPFVVVLLPLTIWTLLKLRNPAARAMYENCPPLDRAEVKRRWPLVITTTACLVFAIYGATIFLVHLGATTLRFEINDPALAVRFGDQTISIDNDGRAFHIKPGTEQEFVVEQNGVEVETDSLTLRKGDKVVLRVSVVHGEISIDTEGADVSVAREGQRAIVSDEVRLKGRWVPESCLMRGQPLTAEQLARMAIELKGDSAAFTDPDSGQKQSGRFSIDASRSPKHIDFIAPDGDERMPGIFEFDGERLKLAWNDGDYARPTNFKPARTPDHMTAVFRRIPGAMPTTEPRDEPPETPVLDETQQEVLKAAEAFLAELDQGRFGAARDLMSSTAKRQTTREAFSNSMQALRDAFGKVKQRTLHRAQLLDEPLPGMSPGRFVGVVYKSDYEQKNGLWESLLLQVDTGGQWRVVSYASTLAPLSLPGQDPAEQKKKDAAEAAARQWLKLVDKAMYGEAWEACAEMARLADSKQKLVSNYRQLFATTGELKSRMLLTRAYKTQMPNAPVGEYAVIQFHTQFARQRVIETVVLTREADRQWRVSGYFHAEENSAVAPPSAGNQRSSQGNTGILTNPPTVPPGGLPTGRNLIEDPSLEETPTGRLPKGWFAWLDDGPDFKCEVVEGGVTGKHCLQISGTGTRGVVFATSIPLDRSKRYALKGRVRVEGEAGTWAVIKLNYFNSTGWLGVDDRVGVTTADFDWKFLEKTDMADKYPAATLIVPTCHIEGNGTAWFDDLQVVAYDREKLPADFDAAHGKNNRMK